MLQPDFDALHSYMNLLYLRNQPRQQCQLLCSHCCCLQGSGKTYTMGTAAGRSDFSSRSGSTAVIPWACRYVLQYVAAARSKYDISIKVRQSAAPRQLPA